MSEAEQPKPCPGCGSATAARFICACGAIKGSIDGADDEVAAVRELALAFAAVAPSVSETATRKPGWVSALEGGAAAQKMWVFRRQIELIQHPWVPTTTPGRRELIKQCLAWRPAATPGPDIYRRVKDELRAAVEQRIHTVLTAWEFDGADLEERSRLAGLVATSSTAPPAAPPAGGASGALAAPAPVASGGGTDTATTAGEPKPPGSLGWLFFWSMWYLIPGIIYYKTKSWTRTQHVIMVAVFIIMSSLGAMLEGPLSRNCPMGTAWNGWRCEAY